MEQLPDITLLNAKAVKRIPRCSLPLVYKLAERGQIPSNVTVHNNISKTGIMKDRFFDLKGLSQYSSLGVSTIRGLPSIRQPATLQVEGECFRFDIPDHGHKKRHTW